MCTSVPTRNEHFTPCARCCAHRSGACEFCTPGMASATNAGAQGGLHAVDVMRALVSEQLGERARDVTTYIGGLTTLESQCVLKDYLIPCAHVLPTCFLIERTPATATFCDDVCARHRLIAITFDGVKGFSSNCGASDVKHCIGLSIARQRFVRRSVLFPFSSTVNVADVILSAFGDKVKVVDYSDALGSLTANEGAKAFLASPDAHSCVCVLQRKQSNAKTIACTHSHVVFKGTDTDAGETSAVAHAIVLFEKRIIVLQEGCEESNNATFVDVTQTVAPRVA